MDVAEHVQRWWPILLILGATAALFAAKDLFSFLLLETPAGRDLAGNYAFAQLMKQNLLHGEVIRWSNQWLLGFPSFAFYPPLFFLLTAGLSLGTGTAVLPWFTVLAFATVFLLPATAYRSLRAAFSRREAVFAGLFSLYFLFVYPPVAQAYQVLSTGLVAQGLAFLLLFPAIGLLFADRERSTLAAGVLLGLTVLAHPFVGLAGFLVAGFYLLLSRERGVLAAIGIGAGVAAPWLLNAAVYLPYLPTYTFGTAEIGLSLLMLLPLAVLGGYAGDERRALLAAFLALLIMGVVELPVVTQEFRFFTYALGLGSVLAGFGADRIYRHLSDSAPPLLLGALLLVPVAGLSLQADTAHTWDQETDNGELYAALEEQEPGRVLVATDNRSVFDSYVIQALIPLRTDHSAANEVHLDSTPTANYLLTAEDWVSARPISNPICRTCGGQATPQLVDRRLDELGVRYVVVRTAAAEASAERFMAPLGRYGDVRLFENVGGHDLVEPLDAEPVAVVGSYDAWQQVNDELFVRNGSVPVAWLRQEPERPDRFSGVVRLGSLRQEAAVERIRAVELDAAPAAAVNATVTDEAVRIRTNASAPVRVKLSWSPRHHGSSVYAGNFNTVLVHPARNATIELG